MKRTLVLLCLSVLVGCLPPRLNSSPESHNVIMTPTVKYGPPSTDGGVPADSCTAAECSLAQAELRTAADKARAGIEQAENKPTEVAYVLFATRVPNKTAIVVFTISGDPVALLYVRKDGKWQTLPEQFETTSMGESLPERRMDMLGRLAGFEDNMKPKVAERKALMFATIRASDETDMAIAIYQIGQTTYGFVTVFTATQGWQVVPEQYQ